MKNLRCLAFTLGLVLSAGAAHAADTAGGAGFESGKISSAAAKTQLEAVFSTTSSILIYKMIAGEADFTLTTCLENRLKANEFPDLSKLTDEEICTTILNAMAAVSAKNEALTPDILLRDTLTFIREKLGRTLVKESCEQIEQICGTVASESFGYSREYVTPKLITELKKYFPTEKIDLDDYLIYQAVRKGLEMLSDPMDLNPPYVTAAIESINSSFKKSMDLNTLATRFAKDLKGDRAGLINNGSMCYQNSVTQAIRWCGPLNALLMSSITSSDYPLVASFSQIMAELNNPTLEHAYDPKEFSDIARYSFFAHSPDRQQDAQEFLMRFLQELHSLKVLTDDKTNGIVTHSSLECQTCLAPKRCSLKEDPTYQLQLNLMESIAASNKGPISIDLLLTAYRREEQTVAGEEICCPAATNSHHANAKTPHIKINEFTINAAQPFTVLHIGRFYQDRQGNSIKFANPVIFSEDGIVIITDSAGTIHQFRIASAVVHVGATINQGHYYTISWNGVYNDTHVHLDDGHSMRQFLTHGYHQNKGANEAQGYLYFLERMPAEDTLTASAAILPSDITAKTTTEVAELEAVVLKKAAFTKIPAAPINVADAIISTKSKPISMINSRSLLLTTLAVAALAIIFQLYK